jgi:hypothetical protein
MRSDNMRSYGSILLAVAIVAAVRPAPAAAQSEGNLQVHGYLSQAFGIADGGTYLGVPQGGTADYRTMALLFSYALDPVENVTVQFSHRRLGESPVTVNEPDVKLDWVFYGRQFGDLNVRVGRIPIPAGIYNEMRNAGITLPLYRAPYDFYLEGSFTSETVDGAVARLALLPSSKWNGELSVYGGSWQTTDRVADQTTGTYVGVAVPMRDGLGGQFWLNTPVDGVRFGLGGMRNRAVGGTYPGTWKEWHGSADLSLSPVTIRAEYRRMTIPGANIGYNTVNYSAYYGYVGYSLTSRLTLMGQADFADVGLNPGGTNIKYDRTTTAGASYRFRSNLVLKGEVHFTKGDWADVPVIYDPTVQSAAKVTYGLISISTSF